MRIWQDTRIGMPPDTAVRSRPRISRIADVDLLREASYRTCFGDRGDETLEICRGATHIGIDECQDWCGRCQGADVPSDGWPTTSSNPNYERPPLGRDRRSPVRGAIVDDYYL